MVKECREYIWEEDMLGNKCNGVLPSRQDIWSLTDTELLSPLHRKKSTNALQAHLYQRPGVETGWRSVQLPLRGRCLKNRTYTYGRPRRT